MGRMASGWMILCALVLWEAPEAFAETRVYVSVKDEQRIAIYDLEQNTAHLTFQESVPIDGEPGALAVSPDGRLLLASIRSKGELASFRIDPGSGSLTLVNQVLAGADPAFVATDQTGRYLLAAYYQAGKVTVHSLSEDGEISEKPLQTVTTDQKAHAILTDPQNRFAFVPHTGPNAIFQFHWDAEKGRLLPNSIPRVQRADQTGPRHLAFHPKLDIVYFDNEQGSSVTAYQLSRETGRLKPFQTLSTLPEGFDKSNSCARLKISDDGRFLYASNRGHDSIAGYQIDSRTGRLTAIGQFATEQTPRGFDIDSRGKCLIAAGQSSGKLATYRINAESGELTREETVEVGKSPWWVQIVDLPNKNALSAIQGEWPTWMGSQLDGIAHGESLPIDWPESGLEEVWSREIGIGFSSMSLSQGRLYTMGHIDGNEFVYCLNAATGEEIWSFDYPSDLNPNLHEGGPAATPTIDEGRVYTLGKVGQLYCFDAATGDILWEHLLTDLLSVPVPEWGFSSTPRVFGDQLVLEGGRVASFDKQTGKLLWQSAEHEAGYGSIAPLEFNGRLLFASLDCEGLRVLDSQDGTELAYYEWLSPFGTNSTTPIVQGDKIFISTGYNVGCGLFQFTGNSLELVYQSRDMRNHFNNSILIDGHLYGFDGNSNLGRVVQLTCLDFETGETKWQQAGYGCGSLMAADGKLLVLSDHGVLAVVEANPKTFGELARADILTNRCWTVPILADGHVFARNARGKLVCVKLPQSPAD